MLSKKLQERNEVYDCLIDYLKGKLTDEAREEGKYIIDEYEHAIVEAERGDKYYIINGLYHGFKGFAAGSLLCGIATQSPVAFAAAALSSGAAIYNYLKYKHGVLDDSLATKVCYAKALQCITEDENTDRPLPFNVRDAADYDDIKAFIEVIQSQQEK